MGKWPWWMGHHWSSIPTWPHLKMWSFESSNEGWINQSERERAINMKDAVRMIYHWILAMCHDQINTYVNANVVVERTATRARRKDKVNDMLLLLWRIDERYLGKILNERIYVGWYTNLVFLIWILAPLFSHFLVLMYVVVVVDIDKCGVCLEQNFLGRPLILVRHSRHDSFGRMT